MKKPILYLRKASAIINMKSTLKLVYDTILIEVDEYGRMTYIIPHFGTCLSPLCLVQGCADEIRNLTHHQLNENVSEHT